MSKQVSFNKLAFVKTIKTICPNGANCHNKNCQNDHPQDTIYGESLSSADSDKKKQVKPVKLMKSSKIQCPEQEKCKSQGCLFAHPWDMVFRV